jgi:hypothetical protein
MGATWHPVGKVTEIGAPLDHVPQHAGEQAEKSKRKGDHAAAYGHGQNRLELR